VLFIEVRCYHGPKQAADQVTYIAHREQGICDGQRRERYRMSPDSAPSACTSVRGARTCCIALGPSGHPDRCWRRSRRGP
jgi:hypothetical protein